MKAETRGFSRTRVGRTAVSGDADDAALLAEQIEGLDGFSVRQTIRSVGRRRCRTG